jgi:hypothetical protein
VQRNWLRTRTAERVLVHTVDDKSIKGYLEVVARDGLLLRAAVLLLEETEHPLDGELWLPRERVQFVQLGGSYQ